MLGMIVAKDVVPKRFRFLFCLAAGVGIVTTFSRGAILGWIVVMGYDTVRSGVSLRKISQVLVVLTLLFGFFTSSYWSNLEHDLEQKGALNANDFQRLKFFSQGNVQDDSAEERQALAAYAISLWEQKPILGWGTGAGQNLEGFSLGAHNIYLALMIDHGLAGALIMPWLLLAIIWGLRKKTFDVAIPYVLFIVLWGFFSHNVLEERFTLLTMALIASMVMQDRLAEKPVRKQAPVSSAAIPLGAYA
jgi:O-antigen ligase